MHVLESTNMCFSALYYDSNEQIAKTMSINHLYLKLMHMMDFNIYLFEWRKLIFQFQLWMNKLYISFVS